VFGKPVSIVNTGAFQRLIDDEKFLALAQVAGKTAPEALRTFKLEKDLPACYAAVLIEYQQQRPDPQVKHWYMEENQDHGELVGPCDSRCAHVSKQCQN
ncbi:MAG: hypothetical protein KDD43_06865, partial [Bdellovibrionales bacterium]|nr:hypothetical protein [Bdellovibrionales bacterium]